MKRFFALCLLFVVSFQLFADDDNEKLKLAVMEFEDLSGKLSKKMLSSATEYIRGAFVSTNKYVVIAKERQEKAMIQEMKRESYKSCNDKNCQIPLGQALSADTILRTTITFFGSSYTITSELIDLEKEATIIGATQKFNGSEQMLMDALDKIVVQIAGGKRIQKEKPAQNSQDHEACEYAKQDGSISTWSDYLDVFPNGECAQEAEAIIDELACGNANKKNSIEAWNLYLKIRPKGKCAFKAKVEIKKLNRKLIWSERSSIKMNWNAAKQYCENLTEGGHSDWRLPNIDELRTTIKNCSKTETGGECRVSDKNRCLDFDQCYNPKGSCYCGAKSDKDSYYSILGDNYKISLWSSSSNQKDIWFVNFYNGHVSSISKSDDSYVRCVR